MRAVVVTKDQGEIGERLCHLLGHFRLRQGYSVNVMEDEIMFAFRRRFMDENHTQSWPRPISGLWRQPMLSGMVQTRTSKTKMQRIQAFRLIFFHFR